MYVWVFMIEVRELVGFKKKRSKLSNITDKHSTGLYHADDLGIFGKLSAANRTEEEENYQNFWRLRVFNNGNILTFHDQILYL